MQITSVVAKAMTFFAVNSCGNTFPGGLLGDFSLNPSHQAGKTATASHSQCLR
jgi:hypothetical protein